ncbi:inorganic diphosphatase [Marinobacterium mangrovicola]|uniref:inorganic diphosphatase n=1 Tax=Marinobacterium mangrovicola TaxID=1476959 RepID=A0A4R1GBR2_9GAMM|nr:inorganic diphosphatase [Marinobacterium mangrovicola]TCK04140.1 inorganic pyrophosphatase [Marinobacterium mangrovicola]
MLKKSLLAAATLLALSANLHAETISGLAYADTARHSEAMTQKDDYTISGKIDLMAQPAFNEDGSLRAVVEIPTGTSAKWEMSKENPEDVYWEYKKGKPRIVNYLGYPGNYGAIPGTALPKELGGDGDPLDVLILGQALPRGEVVDVRLIGVLKMLDDGEQDDKLIAVLTKDSPFANIESLEQLDAEFGGASQIVDLWFSNYKGPDGGMESQGFAGPDEAKKVAVAAAKSYQDQQ